MLRLVLSIVFSLITLHLCSQQKISWVKNGNGFWGIKSNWDCNCLPTILDTVYIEHDSVTIGSIQAYAAQVVVGNAVNNPAGLQVQANGGLIIFGSVQKGLYVHGNQSSIRNLGEIDLSGSMQDAIRFEGLLFENTSSGSILIASSSIAGIYNDVSSNFVNEGRIIMNSPGQSGVRNTGTFTNHGALHIRDSGTGLNNWVSGSIPLFTNTDSLIIVNGFTGIYNLGEIDNQFTGIIQIDSINGKGILNPGLFTNTGILKIQQTEGDGIDISGGASFINQNFTSLVRTGQDGANDAIENNGYILNDLGALIQIDTTNQHGLNNLDTLINSGTIEISEVSSIGFLNGNFLSNQGTITINQAPTGFYNSLNSEAYNSSSISISNATTTMLQILQNSIFDHLLFGSLTVGN